MTMYFTKEHEWIRVDGDTATVGISDHAQEQLGDIVFAEVPDAGRRVTRRQEAAVVESVKAASDVYAPVSGEVLEGNQALALPNAERAMMGIPVNTPDWIRAQDIAMTARAAVQQRHGHH